MKQIKIILSIAMIAMIGVFTACEEDENAMIDITPKTTNPDTVVANTEVTLQFSVITDENIESIKLTKNDGQIKLKEDNFKDKTSDTFVYNDTLAKSNEAGTTLNMALTVTDSKDNMETYNFKIEVAPIETIEVTEYKNKTLEVALQGGTAEDLFSIEHGNRYSYNYLDNNNMKDSADIIFGHEGLTKALAFKLLSPDYSTSVTIHNDGTLPNTTNYNVVTDSYTFTDITAEDIQNISDLTNTSVTIVEGDIVAFVTNDGHKGFLKVNAINNPDGEVGNGDDELDFDAKTVMASEMQ